ncbi:hypothetical protein ACTP3E_10270 [Streptococcus pneumoniae]
MKGLKHFLQFDLDGFLKDKEVTFLDAKPYYNYKDGKVTEELLGMKLECVITQDNTNYNNQDFNNEYEKITVKVAGVEKVNINRGAKIKIQGKAKVWGDYSQNLSIEATNVQVVKNKDDR